MIKLLPLLIFIASIAEGKMLRIAGIEGAPSFIYNTSSMRPGGRGPVFIDLYLTKGLKEKFNLDVDWHQAPAARLMKELETGELDVLCFLLKTPEREKIFNYSKQPFLEGRPTLLVKKSLANKNDVSISKRLKNKTIGVMAGTQPPLFFQENNITTYPVSGIDISDRMISLLKSSRIDGVLVYLPQVGEYVLKSYGLENQFSMVTLPGDPLKMYVAFRKGLGHDLRDFIEQTFAKHREDYDKISLK